MAQLLLDNLILLNELAQFLQQKGLYEEFLEFLVPELREKFESSQKDRQKKHSIYI